MTTYRSFPAVAMEFFDRFARFENALKRAGYLKNTDTAEADWDRFARDLDPGFFEEIRAAAQAATIVNAPPKKRIRKLGKLEWQDQLKVTNAETLFLAVRRARNNLFHGEKFIGNPAGDKRSEQLLTESLWVLERSLTRNAEVRAAYEAARA